MTLVFDKVAYRFGFARGSADDCRGPTDSPAPPSKPPPPPPPKPPGGGEPGPRPRVLAANADIQDGGGPS
jgi:hypothetical protein